MPWEKKKVPPEAVMERIRPGMVIFIGTGAAEPSTLVECLTTSGAGNLQDLEIIQVASFSNALTAARLRNLKFRLKTFSSGSVVEEAISAGRVDLIPSRLSRIPQLMEVPHFRVDAAFVQVTPPDETGNCSLGIAVDAARQAMERASLVVGEINPRTPRTFGDTFVHVSDFDFFVEARQPPMFLERSPAGDAALRIGAHLAALIEDGSCLVFSIGPIYEALAAQLAGKKHLGIHSPVMTDAVMDLMTSGVVSNRKKETYRGKSLVSYALGTRRLLEWLDRNPLVEFQGVDKVLAPLLSGRNPRFVPVVPADQIDLSGRIALPCGRASLALGPAEVFDLAAGADMSPGGRILFALPSRDPAGVPTIRVSIRRPFQRFDYREAVGTVVTEYGVAHLGGLTLRERAQALIDLAHPDDRPQLVEQAKARRILYPDQIFVAASGSLYPHDLAHKQPFRNGVTLALRGIKPSDEEEMRRLFYRFSKEAVYSRYFGHVTAMPHAKMQAYVNVDWRHVFSVVAVAGEPGQERVVAEARYIRIPGTQAAEVVFVVDEAYQGIGLATHLYRILIEAAKKRGIRTFVADVLFSNTAMMKVFRKAGLPVTARLEGGTYNLKIHLAPGDAAPAAPQSP